MTDIDTFSKYGGLSTLDVAPDRLYFCSYITLRRGRGKYTPTCSGPSFLWGLCIGQKWCIIFKRRGIGMCGKLHFDMTGWYSYLQNVVDAETWTLLQTDAGSADMDNWFVCSRAWPPQIGRK